MIIGCTGNYRKADFFSILDKIHNFLSDKEIQLLISNDLLKSDEKINHEKYNLIEFDELVVKSDVLLAIGGDGTILSTVRRLGGNQKPIMGIHIGGLGFLSGCMENNLESSLHDIINHRYEISERMLLEVKFSDGGNRQILFALNDIVVDHGPSARILKTEVLVSGNYLNTYEGDGLIFSSPTGSTAYSLSAGGPIIYPDMEIITVTPICSHSLSARPIVLRGGENIELNFPDSSENFSLSVDGQVRFKINKDTCISIVKAKHNAKLINLLDSSYFDTLRTKMGWSGNIR